MLRAGSVLIDVGSREVRVCERRADLSATEYQPLLALASDPYRCSPVRSSGVRLGARHVRPVQDVDTHAFRLRRKLCEGSDERLVVNVWGE